MDYKDAIKKVQNKKIKETYLVFKFGYDVKFVLPHKDGVAMISSLAAAEQLNDPYNAQHSIGPIERGKVEITQMSQEEYEHYKISVLLGITVSEAKEHALNSD